MAAPAYYARTYLAGDDLFAQELPTNAVAGHPYHELPVTMGLFNKKGSGKLVNVRLFNCRPMTTAQSLTAMAQLVQISAASGEFSTVTPFKYDSDNSTPTDVTCLYMPRSITGATVLRRVMLLPMQNMTRQLGTWCAMTHGDARSGSDSSEFYRQGGDADMQPLVLHAGQGLAVTFAGVNAMPIHAFSVTMVLRRVSDGQTYRYYKVIEPRQPGDGACFSLLVAGGGADYRVQRIQLREIGTDEEPQIAYEPLDELDEGAELPDLQAFDSAAPLDSNIVVRANAYAVRRGGASGALISVPMMRRAQLTEAPWFAGATGVNGLTRRGPYAPDMLMKGDSIIVLREGQGLGLRKISPSAKCSHEVQLLFDVEDAAPPAGGGNTYSRGRVVNR